MLFWLLSSQFSLHQYQTSASNEHAFVGFVAAAVSMPMGGCRARRSLVVDVDVAVTVEPAVL